MVQWKSLDKGKIFQVVGLLGLVGDGCSTRRYFIDLLSLS